jgi:hypothetical protein
MVKDTRLPQHLLNRRGLIDKALEDAIKYNEGYIQALGGCPDFEEAVEQTKELIKAFRALLRKRKTL